MNIKEIIQDAIEDQQARIIRPLNPEDKAARCTCGHYLRYHNPQGDILICKYNSCKCKGYKQGGKR
jgi:hypothetical protein